MIRNVLMVALVLCTALNGQQNDPHPIQLAQLRELLDATSITEISHNLVLREVAEQKSQLPPWWPDAVWKEMADAMANVDQAPIALPFYQKCYTEQDARFFIHLFETSEGHAYGRRIVGLQAEDQVHGASASAARSDMMTKDQGFSAELIKTLDSQDQQHAEVVFGTHRGADISACVSEVFPRAVAAVQAEQIVRIKALVEVHRAELAAAESKYNAEQATKKIQHNASTN